MALSVVNNLTAITAQSQLGASTNKLSNSLKQLSTGERINSAADDPSGLAISERFRTQIRGLGRATSNAMDGISMLQTAEGALNEMHSILQRQRELAVQASNGTLTASDRQEVQKEFDQLKDEINRISDTTEFNTRKLLDGKGSALWSAGDSNIGAVVTGRVAEGNYRLDVSQDVGVNQVLKTDIFRVADGKIAAVDDGTPSYVAFVFVSSGSAQTATFVLDDQTITISFSAGNKRDMASALARAINTNEDIDGRLEAALGNGDEGIIIRATAKGDAGKDFSIRMAGGTYTTWDGYSATLVTAALTAGGTFKALTELADTTLASSLANVGNNNSESVASVYDPVGLTAGDYNIITKDNETNFGDFAKIAGAHMNTTSTAHITAAGADVGENHYAMVEVTQGGGDGSVDFRVSWDQGQNWQLVQDYSSGADITLGGPNGTESFKIDFSGSFVAGDKLLLGLQDGMSLGTDIAYLEGPASSYSNLTTPDTGSTWRDSDQVQRGLWVDTGTDDATGTTGHVLTMAWMDDSGATHFGSVTMDAGSNFGAVSALSTKLTITGSGGIADSNTKLSDIDRFYDANGTFLLGDSGKWIDIYDGGGNKASFLIEGSDTLGDVSDKIAQAITQQTTSYGWAGLNMGDVTDGGVSKAATYVQTPKSGDEAVAGTIVIRSTVAGSDGALTFNADESVLNALSLATIQDAVNGVKTVSVYNAHTNGLLAKEETGDNILHNVIQGIDVKFDSRANVDATWNSNTNKIEFSAEDASHFLHVVDKSMDLQIGANQGQTMTAYIGEMSTEGLGIQNSLVVSQDLAQDAIGQLDGAIQKVSSERARIGAYINRLDHTLNNLSVQEENQTAAESTIRDLNMAKAVSEMTQQQILQQVGTSMLAQANQLPQSIMSLLR